MIKDLISAEIVATDLPEDTHIIITSNEYKDTKKNHTSSSRILS